eukprot:gene28592-36875_t
MSYHSSKFVVDRIDYLRQLVREKDGNSRHFANDSSEKKARELDKLVRILRPANQQANDHTHAIRLRLRQAILNHPNAASEGPLLLSRFDKVFDSLKRLSPLLGGPVLAFLKPLSFKSIPTFTRHLPDAIEEDQRLAEDTDHRLFLILGIPLPPRSTRGPDPTRFRPHDTAALSDKAGYAALVGQAARNGVAGPFRFRVGQDDKDPETYVINLAQGGIG